MVPVWRPLDDDYVRLFDEQNPWHRSGRVPSALAPESERPLAQMLWRRLVSDVPRRYQVILGPRRTGKTTVLYQTVRHLLDHGIEPQRIWWMRLDHPMLIEHDLGAHVRNIIHRSDATSQSPAFVMLDEVVHSNQWDLWLKTFHDEKWPVRIAATSSSTGALQQRRHESGVGRWEVQFLKPCDLFEFMSLTGNLEPSTEGAIQAEDTLAATTERVSADPHDPLATELCKAGAAQLEKARRFLIHIGGFPELFMGSPPTVAAMPEVADHLLSAQRILRDDAVIRAVYKDIPQTASVDNPKLLERLLYVLAAEVTGIVSPSRISSQIGVAQPTLDRHLSYLEQTYLVFTLTNYSGREALVQRRGRKAYFVDSAVRNAALQRGLAVLRDPVEQGVLLENTAASAAASLAEQAGVRLHHWRLGNHEVDLVYDDPNQPLAFEIASSVGHTRKGLLELIRRHPRLGGHSYLVAPQAGVVRPDDTSGGVGTLPLDLFLLLVGAQTRKAVQHRMGFFN